MWQTESKHPNTIMCPLSGDYMSIKKICFLTTHIKQRGALKLYQMDVAHAIFCLEILIFQGLQRIIYLRSLSYAFINLRI